MCGLSFVQESELDQHLSVMHIPNTNITKSSLEREENKFDVEEHPSTRDGMEST